MKPICLDTSGWIEITVDGAILWTQEEGFKDLHHIKYFPKKQSNLT